MHRIHNELCIECIMNHASCIMQQEAKSGLHGLCNKLFTFVYTLFWYIYISSTSSPVPAPPLTGSGLVRASSPEDQFFKISDLFVFLTECGCRKSKRCRAAFSGWNTITDIGILCTLHITLNCFWVRKNSKFIRQNIILIPNLSWQI